MSIPYDVFIYIFDLLIEDIGLLKCLHLFQLNKEINKRLHRRYQSKIEQEKRFILLSSRLTKIIKKREELKFPHMHIHIYNRDQLYNEVNTLHHQLSVRLRKEYHLNKGIKVEIYFNNMYNKYNYSSRLF